MSSVVVVDRCQLNVKSDKKLEKGTKNNEDTKLSNKKNNEILLQTFDICSR